MISYIYKIFRVLSFDVIIGVVAMALFANHLLQLHLNIYWLVILILATWSFYTFDHLVDGFKTKDKALIFRHLFHYKFRITLSILAIISAFTAIILAYFYLEKLVITAGLLLGLIGLIYFLILSFTTKKNLFFQKEIIIAFVYVVGIWMAPIITKNELPGNFVFLSMLVVFFLAFAEGIMASYFDYEKDIIEGHSSFTVMFGRKSTNIFLITLHILVFVLLFYLITLKISELQLAAVIIMLLMNTILLFINIIPQLFVKNDTYRIIGEMVFWIPALLVLF
ncbi:MAG: hypothetical protein C0595_09070 [Marinilabiliales bacterium]|nr:MAG: hypothetical protein C0595_09070 [Marinilabiliales bacterium]